MLPTPMSPRAALRLLLACCIAGLVVPSLLGLTYTRRLATRPERYGVTVSRPPSPPPAIRRPRRAAVVVLDGLGREEARGMRSFQRAHRQGQCRDMDVGPLSISRPVYAVLSTGVEQDRGGPLINDATMPDTQESIWEVAHEAGFSVAGVSELPWWKDMFPRAFSAYLTLPQGANYFDLAPSAALLLIHPLYIDEAGHAHGAASSDYRAATDRADQELSAFMDTLDLERDLLVVTADHGHALRGGHGGRQDRVAHVLTCYAGPGVRRQADIHAMSATSFAPSLSLLLGLRFPSGMRAGEDDLDTLWDIADERAFPPAYLDAQRREIERFRLENQAQLARWLPSSGGGWAALYRAHRLEEAMRALPFLGLFILMLAIHLRYHHRSGQGGRAAFAFGVAWSLGCALSAYLLQLALRGSFDMTSVNNRQSFLTFTLALGLAVSTSFVLLHLSVRRSLTALAWDLSLLSAAGTLACIAHPAALGWHAGFPVPPPPLFFFPFFATLFLTGVNGVGLFVLALARSPRWRVWASRHGVRMEAAPQHAPEPK